MHVRDMYVAVGNDFGRTRRAISPPRLEPLPRGLTPLNRARGENNITGGNSQLFIHRLVELECHQLEQLIINIQFEINQPRVSQLFNTIFFTTLNQVENLSNSFGYDVNGMTANLQKNEECLNALKELNCIYDISGVSTPPMRLLMTVMMTGMNCYNTNKISQTIDNHLETPISEDIQEQFKNL